MRVIWRRFLNVDGLCCFKSKYFMSIQISFHSALIKSNFWISWKFPLQIWKFLGIFSLTFSQKRKFYQRKNRDFRTVSLSIEDIAPCTCGKNEFQIQYPSMKVFHILSSEFSDINGIFATIAETFCGEILKQKMNLIFISVSTPPIVVLSVNYFLFDKIKQFFFFHSFPKPNIERYSYQ